MKSCRRIFLVGMMGSGKTLIGKMLARELGWRFADTDYFVERRERKRVSLIFKEKGEVYFRKVESLALKESAARSPCVVATGGGLVVKKDNRMWMRKKGVVVYLRVASGTLFDRMKKKGIAARPLLHGEHPRQALILLRRAREKYYKEADFLVSGSQPPRVVIKRILNRLPNGFLVF
jgi:shikimate kinase